MIKTILFDFGDVFINLDKAATANELKKFEFEDFTKEMLERNKKYETGTISSEEFINFYLDGNKNLTKESFTSSWNSILKDFPSYRFEFIKKLAEQKKYQLILLSNTNEIHIEWVKKNIPFFEKFKDCFDAFYLSQELNMRKPEASIYQFILKKHHLIPQEVLFIDDTKENTDAAAKLGIHTWNIDPATKDVVDLFTHKKELF